MQLEDYFDFQRPDDIRIKGTRIGIESLLYEYAHRGQSAEEIAARFPTVTLEQVYATILFYLHNKETVSAYLADWLEWGRVMREQQERNPHAGIIHLRELKEALTAEAGESVGGWPRPSKTKLVPVSRRADGQLHDHDVDM